MFEGKIVRGRDVGTNGRAGPCPTFATSHGKPGSRPRSPRGNRAWDGDAIIPIWLKPGNATPQA
jgi:hypothetical protein